jgi:uncharacterized protein with von Willebrand factor type A (vWA) domain
VSELSVVGPVSELVAEMRARGSVVGVGELLVAFRALAAVDAAVREDARLALRAALCSCREDLSRFDEAFASVFGGVGLSLGGPLAELGEISRAVLPHASIPGSAPVSRERLTRAVPAAWSDVELLRETDFALYSELDVLLARGWLARLARRTPVRMSRRTRIARRGGHALDLRRTVRASLRTSGDPVHRVWRAPSVRERPVVLVCDVSGSMSPYARMLLAYMHACVAAHRRVEAFAFGTRLTRVTAELSARDPDLAFMRAAAAVADWGGGTRIGIALAALNREHGRRIGRGSDIVILSDGWDRGDPEMLRDEMARLRRTAHRLIWLNPLAAHPDYEPLTRGMRAAVPYADELLAGNSLGSLERLVQVLEA